jgi:hypothetical protein
MAHSSAWGRKGKEGEIGLRSEAPHPNFATSSSWEAMRLRFVKPECYSPKVERFCPLTERHNPSRNTYNHGALYM